MANNIINPTFLAQMKAETKKAIKLVNISQVQKEEGYRYWLPTPAAINAIAKYGAENIFLVLCNYKSHYDDDDATFIYWNNATGEFFDDTWTTRGACPNYSLYECCKFKVALAMDAIDKEALVEAIRTRMMKQATYRPCFSMKDFKNVGLKVTVKGGRKYKGEGYLVDMFDKSYQWGAPRYRSHYYGPSNYGTTTTAYAKIYNPEKNEVYTVTAKYVIVEGVEDMVKKYEEYNKAFLESATVDNLDFSEEMPKIANFEITSFNEWVAKNYGHEFDLSTANDEEKNKEEAKKQAAEAKHQEFKEKKMAQLIEWVKNNTDKKTEEDIKNLAEHIFNKRYN